MHPEPGERLSGRGLGLGNLVLVVGELQVDPASVDVEALAKICHRHRGAFQVPSRPSRAEGAVPARLPRAGRLPEHEVAGVVLVIFVGVHPGARADAAGVQAGELAVLGPAADAKVRRTGVAIGVARALDASDEPEHLGNVLGGRRNPLGSLQAKRAAVLEERVYVPPGVLPDRDALARCRRDDLVLHVRDVHHVQEVPAGLPQMPPEDVLEGKRAQVADMDVVVDGRPAGVHPDGPAVSGLERLDSPAQAVVKLESHQAPAGTRSF